MARRFVRFRSLVRFLATATLCLCACGSRACEEAYSKQATTQPGLCVELYASKDAGHGIQQPRGLISSPETGGDLIVADRGEDVGKGFAPALRAKNGRLGIEPATHGAVQQPKLTLCFLSLWPSAQDRRAPRRGRERQNRLGRRVGRARGEGRDQPWRGGPRRLPFRVHFGRGVALALLSWGLEGPRPRRARDSEHGPVHGRHGGWPELPDRAHDPHHGLRQPRENLHLCGVPRQRG